MESPGGKVEATWRQREATWRQRGGNVEAPRGDVEATWRKRDATWGQRRANVGQRWIIVEDSIESGIAPCRGRGSFLAGTRVSRH